MFKLVFLAVLFWSTSSFSQSVSNQNLDGLTIQKEIESWKPWFGVWEGKLMLEGEETPGLIGEKQEPMELRMVITRDYATVFVLNDKRVWQQFGSKTQGIMFSPLSLTVAGYTDGGGWVESITINLNRSADDSTEASFIRFVNNWSLKEGGSFPKTFNQFRKGKFQRVGPVPTGTPTTKPM